VVRLVLRPGFMPREEEIREIDLFDEHIIPAFR
jgi:hypothetical protein